ncbi:MAG TPA: ATP-binding protein [Thermoanaerobaculia bacterium]|nr:ATP-binding protein [Thermoanaerobaculia bacterium]
MQGCRSLPASEPIHGPPHTAEALSWDISQALVESSADGILAFDSQLRYILWNPAMERISGVPRAEALGRNAFELVPFLVESGEDHAFRAALAGRSTVTRDRPYRVPATGKWGFFEGYYSPLRNAAGEIVGGLGVIRDVTERREAEEGNRQLLQAQAARAEAEASRQRFAFLAEVSRVLSSSLDEDETFAGLARLLVPALGDYCIIDVFEDSGGIRRAVARHKDPAGQELMNELRRFPPALGSQTGIGRVMRTGEPLFSSEVDEEQVRTSNQDPELLRLLLALAPRSSILVPMMSRGRVFGAITLAVTGDERRYGPEDFATAEEMGHRAALAIDNSRLYQRSLRLAQELRQHVADLATADQRKDEFLAMLAHELRNPLAAISSAGHVLGQTRSAVDPQAAELAAVIGRQTRHLTRLVDDLLDVSRFTRGKIELHKGLIELRHVVQGAVETTRPLIERRRHDLTIALPDEPLWLEADATRLAQVLANLLHNAAKFTEPGGHIALTVGRQGGEVAVAVRDDGSGIDPALLPRIFDLFVQEDRSLARSHGGLGIGLTLVRSLVEKHGGRVEAYSEGPGRGSELTVHLPLCPGPQQTIPAAPQVEAAGEPPSRILVVEDNADTADALAELLRLWGHEVTVVHDGLMALEAARNVRPEVVLLDIGLPGMDGYEVARALRSLGSLDGALLIALTGYGQDSDRHRSQLAGFDHHMVKPVDVPRLRQIIARQPA